MIYWIIHKPLIESDLDNPLEVTPIYFYQKFSNLCFVDIHELTLAHRLEIKSYCKKVSDRLYDVSVFGERYIRIKNRKDLCFLDNATDKDIFILQNEGSFGLKFFLAQLNNRNLKSVLFSHWKNTALYLNNTNQINTKKNIKTLLNKRKDFCKKLICKISYRMLPKKLRIDYLYASSNKICAFFKSNYEVKKILPCHSVSYDKCRNLADSESYMNKYIVFIDQGVTFHPDENKKFTPEIIKKYRSEILSTLRYFQKKTGYDVFIAKHPRVKYSQDYWSEFKSFNGETTKLIKHSEFVLGHSSTALYESLFFQKKVVFLKSSNRYFYINNWVEDMFNFMGGDLFDMATLKLLSSKMHNDLLLSDYFTLLPKSDMRNQEIFENFFKSYV